MDEHDDPQQEVPELRNAFSQTTAEACENYVEEHIRQVQQNNSNHDSPTSSVDMKRASSVRKKAKALTIVTVFDTIIIAITSLIQLKSNFILDLSLTTGTISQPQ